jgi:hypothetical protein
MSFEVVGEAEPFPADFRRFLRRLAQIGADIIQNSRFTFSHSLLTTYYLPLTTPKLHHSIKNNALNFPHWFRQNLPLQQGLPQFVIITALWKKYNGK